MPMLAVAILREAASDQDMKNGARAFTATARTPTEVADALPWIRKDVDVIRMHRLSLYILIVAIVVLWPGEVGQEPQVGDSLEKEERTLAVLVANELHRSVPAQLFREKKRDEAVGAKLLNFIEEALDEVAFAVECEIAIALSLSIGFGRNYGRDFSLRKHDRRRARSPRQDAGRPRFRVLYGASRGGRAAGAIEKPPSAGAPAARETPQPYRLNNLRREPSCAGFHVHMRELDAGWCDVDRAEHDRQREPAGPDGARVEHGDPAVDADEWYVRVPAHDQRGALGLGHAGDRRAQLRAVDRDMRQQDSQRSGGRDVEHERVGQIARACVDVAAHGVDRRYPGKLVEHRQVANVSGVQDRVGSDLGEARRGGWVRLRMSVRDRRKAHRAVCRDRY
jgi:hypothetical protein